MKWKAGLRAARKHIGYSRQKSVHGLEPCFHDSHERQWPFVFIILSGSEARQAKEACVT